jgi:hypothetical protein
LPPFAAAIKQIYLVKKQGLTANRLYLSQAPSVILLTLSGNNPKSAIA